jgi:hypothetical protein
MKKREREEERERQQNRNGDSGGSATTPRLPNILELNVEVKKKKRRW